MTTIREFPNEQAARDYRHDNGTGGWIFVPEDSGSTLLFSPEVPPFDIFHHPITRGRAGNLIGSA